MLCENCHQNQAAVHVQQNVNGKKTEMNLCQNCAGIVEVPVSFENIVHGFLGSFLSNPNVSVQGASEDNFKKCQSCGMSYESFKNTGRLGCADCYAAFNEPLRAVLKNVQGSNVHQGKIPGRFFDELHNKREIDKLRLELSKSIEKEMYEDAARIRDRVRELEKRDQHGKMV